MNGVVYPKFAEHGRDSITQHYFWGMPNTFLSDCHTCNCPKGQGHLSGCRYDIAINIPEVLKESNSICGHIGSSGFYEPPMFKFIKQYWHKFGDILEIEKKNPDIFWWAKFRKEKGAVKLHTQFDVKANIPTFIDITNGLTHDVHFLDKIIYEAGAFYIADKALLEPINDLQYW